MKYTSKRVYKNARKSQRMYQTGGFGWGNSGTIKLGNGKSKIKEYNDLFGAEVQDNNVKFSYKIGKKKTTSTQILEYFTLDKIQNIKKGANMEKMINTFYNIPSNFSFIQNNGFDTTKLQSLQDKIKNIPVSTTTLYGFYHNKITYKDTPKSISIINMSHNTMLTEEKFKKNVLKYFKTFKVIPSVLPLGPSSKPSLSAPPSGLLSTTSSGPPTGPPSSSTSSGPPTGPPSGPPSGPPTGTPIGSTDIPEILKIIPDAKFDGTELLSKTKIIKGVDGKYYATETTYNVKC
jgi:hypothetical protein